MLFPFLSFFFLIFTGSAPALHAQEYVFEGDTLVQISAQNNGFANLPTKYFGEFWTYHLVLDNGLTLTYYYAVSDLGNFKDRGTSARLSVGWKDGQDYVINKIYSLDDFEYDPETLAWRLDPKRDIFGEPLPNGQQRLVFRHEKHKVAYDLNVVLENMKPGFVLTNNPLEVQGNDVGMSFPVQHFKMTGTFALNGDTVSANGEGFLDHVYQTSLVPDIFEKGIRIFSGDGQNGWLGNVMIEKKTSLAKGYLIRLSQGKPQLLNVTAWESQLTAKAIGAHIDTRIKLFLSDGSSLILHLDKIQSEFSILEELGFFKRQIVRSIMGGEVVEYFGRGTFDDGTPLYFNAFSVK